MHGPGPPIRRLSGDDYRATSKMTLRGINAWPRATSKKILRGINAWPRATSKKTLRGRLQGHRVGKTTFHTQRPQEI